MKRGGPLRRIKPLAGRAAPLPRSKAPLRRKTRLRPSRRQKAILRPETRAAAFARSGGRCVRCGKRATQAHHIWPRQRWPKLVDVAENVVGLCQRCHERHELAVERLPRSCLPDCATGLVVDGRMASYIERTYPLDGH